VIVRFTQNAPAIPGRFAFGDDNNRVAVRLTAETL
jgi:hypothetical protein